MVEPRGATSNSPGDPLGQGRELRDAREQSPRAGDPRRPRAPGADPGAILDVIVERAARLCGAEAAQLYLLDGDVFRLSRVSGAVPEEYRRYLRGPPGRAEPARPRWGGWPWTGGPSRSPTCSPTRTTAAGTSSELGRLPHPARRRRCCRRRGRRRARRVAHRRSTPFDERERRAARRRSPRRRRSRCGSVDLVRALEARSAELAEQGRPARGAARGRRGGQLEPRPRRGARRRSSANAVRSPAPTAARSWSTTRRATRFRVRAPTAPAPSCSSGCAAITIDRDDDARRPAPRWSAVRCRSPTSARLELDPHLEVLLRRRLALGARRADAPRATGSSAPWSSGAGRPGAFSDETASCSQTFASQSALAIVNARLFRELEQQSARAGGGQPAQVGVPGQHVARAAHPAQRGDRVLRGAAGADVRRAQRAAGGVPPRHLELGQAPARAAQRDPRPVQGRGRADGARADHVLACATRSSTASRWCASAPPRTASTLDARRRPTTSAWSTPTSCGFKQVVLNLLSNAVKFTPDGGTRRGRAPAATATSSCVTVTDTGIGIAAGGPASGSSSPSSRAARRAAARRAPASA